MAGGQWARRGLRGPEHAQTRDKGLVHASAYADSSTVTSHYLQAGIQHAQHHTWLITGSPLVARINQGPQARPWTRAMQQREKASEASSAIPLPSPTAPIRGKIVFHKTGAWCQRLQTARKLTSSLTLKLFPLMPLDSPAAVGMFSELNAGSLPPKAKCKLRMCSVQLSCSVRSESLHYNQSRSHLPLSTLV